MSAIVWEGVEVSYASGAYCAVRGLNLAVAPGEFLCVVGPTGCGKSTILNVAAAGERGLAFDVQGAPNVSYNLQGSSDLTKWTQLQAFTTDASGRAHLAPTAAGLNYFFRITAGPAN